jgi:putative ABC transport system substrate-binding protein
VNRRSFAAGLVALAAFFGLICPASAADAQQPASPRRIGLVLVAFSSESKEAQAFRRGLVDAGYAEGRDVAIERRSANGDYDQIPVLVADLVQRKVEVIVVDGTVATRAAKRSTSTIPIVMAIVADPVASGLVTSLAHPGGNITGLSLMSGELAPKRLQLLKDAIPRATRVAILWNPDTPFHKKAVQDLKAAAPAMSIELKFFAMSDPDDLPPAFSAAKRARAQAVYVIESAFFGSYRDQLASLATKASLPTMNGERRIVEAGALMSYGANFADMYRRAAGYVDKILKGAKPGDLPIEQPTKFELVVNLKTAKALGITIPESILLRADEVIR